MPKNVAHHGWATKKIFEFYTVNHTILLQKLHKIGIRGTLLKWFTSYLDKRKQHVIVNGFKSTSIEMEHGIPQGSVLGPLLFLIYVNDMPESSKKFLYTLFADDTCLFLSHKDPKTLETLVNAELSKVNEWLVNNRLTLNIDKSCFILFSGKKDNHTFKLSISGTEIKRVNHPKYLGILIDENLDWKPQIDKTLLKLKQGTGILRKLGYLIHPDCLKSIYYCFIQSNFQYCINAWGSPKTTGLSKINDIVKKCVNNINKRGINILNFNFNPLKVNDIYKLESCKLIHSYVHKNFPPALDSFFSYSANHGRVTRQIQRNALTTIHYEHAGSPVTFYGPQIWNQLCLPLHNLSQKSFSNSLKKKLKDNQ